MSTRDRVMSALLKAAERIGAGNAKKYVVDIKRDRRGVVTRGYTISEDHQRVIDTIDQYARCKIDEDEAMNVLYEYGVFKGRTS